VSLSPFDDYPIHQIADVVRHVGTSDRNFYDRYYFGCHGGRADLPYLITGLGVYPNLGVTDAFASVRNGEDIVVFRASRALGDDRADLKVGPYRIEVVEGLKKVRVILEPGDDYDLAFDITYTGEIPASLEPGHYQRQLGRVMFDTSRFAQTGTWAGQLTVDGTTHELDGVNWSGNRDRSWGIRPVGEGEPAGRRATLAGGFFWLYNVISFPEYSIVFINQEDEHGTKVVSGARRVWRDPAKGIEELGPITHDITLVPGTREASSAVITLGDITITAEIVLPHYFGFGTGYGLDPDWRHGMWQGDLVVQGKRYKTAELDATLKLLCPVDNLATFRLVENGVENHGSGLFEFGPIGPHKPSGLTGFVDTHQERDSDS
jgi:hypothetical protein